MEFTVPKFIEKEAKIIGPLTFKQFLCLLIPGATVFLAYYTLPLAIAILLAIVLMSGGIALAFLKIGGRSFPVVMKNFVTFYPSVKLYVWKRKAIPPKIIKKEEVKQKKKEIAISPKVTESKLKNLSSRIETFR
jgi:thiol:disulfide interchange protein